MDIGEELGEGVKRIFDEMRFAGLAEPVYEQTSTSVRLILPGEPAARRLARWT
jgi:ATP-dependent DNA helicase RecG